jgi:hypothetical protein
LGVVHPFDALNSDSFFSQGLTHFLTHTFNGVFKRFVGFDFQHKVHPALKVESQIDFFMGPETGLKCRQYIDNGRDDDR